jgi:ABC-type glycerol-3-phosphate transport system substrate-binding protein
MRLAGAAVLWLPPALLRPAAEVAGAAAYALGRGARRGVGGGGTGWAITRATKVADEAWGLVAQIASKQGQLDEVAIGQTTPSRVSVVTGKEYLDPTQPPKNSRAFADGQDYVVRDPMHARWSEIERDVVARVMTDLLWTGQATASQVAAEIKAKADPLFKPA